MGGGTTKPGTHGYMVAHGFKSKYERSPSRSGSTHYWNGPNSARYSPSPPRRVPTQEELNKKEEARVRAKWNAMERTIAAEKARLAAEAKRIANAIKKQKEKNNRLAAAAAVNVKNAANLNKVFKNNKTILARLRRLVGRTRK